MKRIAQLDLIRVAAAVGVVIIHTWASFANRPDFFGTKFWWVMVVVTVIAAPSVMLFFGMSGYLVLPKGRGVRDNLVKTCSRLIVPLLIFEVIFGVYDYATKYHWGGEAGYWPDFWRNFVEYPNSALWFLITLSVLYLLNPLWQLLFESEKNRAVARYVVGFFLLLPVVNVVLEVLGERREEMYTVLTSILDVVGVYLYGGLMAKNWDLKLKTRQWGMVFGVSLLAMLAINYGQANWAAVYVQPAIRIFNLGLFVSILNLLMTLPVKPSKWLTYLAGLSFGVYLWHTLVVAVIHDILGVTFDNSGINLWVYAGGYLMVVLLASGILAQIGNNANEVVGKLVKMIKKT